MKKLSTLFVALLLTFVLLFASACSNSSEITNGSSDSSVASVTTASSSSVIEGTSSVNSNSVTSSQSKNSQTGSNSQSVSNSQPTGGSETPVVDGLPVNMTKGGLYPTQKEGDIFLSPNGSDSNAGTEGSPMFNLSAAIAKATAGTTIFMMPGQYDYSQTIQLTKSGVEGKPITIQAYNWQQVIIDFKKMPYGKNESGWGFMLRGNYWHIQGLTIQYAGDNAIKVEGSYNYIGRVITHHNGDTGIQLGFGHTTNKDNPGYLCAYNTIENCDSYKNYDYDNHQDADGFACKMHNGLNNVFIGCRAWSNCDDGWDLYETNYPVYIVDCWAWRSAKKEDLNDFDAAYLAANKVSIGAMGNGNGIKLGGNGTGGDSYGQHYVYNCVAFGNDLTGSVKGFDENNHKYGNIVKNCVAWDNGYNYMFENGTPQNTTIENCLSFRTPNGTQQINKLQMEFEKMSKLINNNFDYDPNKPKDCKITTALTADDFITISLEAAMAPRQADGSLPDNGFAMLKSTSSLYGKGMGRI